MDATLGFVSDEFPAPEMNNQNRIGVGCRGGELGSNPDTRSYLVYSVVFIDENWGD